MEDLCLPPGIKLQWHRQLDSTNQHLLGQDAAQGVLVVADEQLAGRGRMQRTWQSPAGLNLYFSLALRPNQPARVWGTLPLAVGVGVADGLAALGFVPQLKWPNDILLAGKKTGGILLEARGAAVVAGVGLNVNQLDFPGLPQATSLAVVQGNALSRPKVLEAVLDALWRRYEQWCGCGPHEILQSWLHYDVLQDKEIEIFVQDRLISATVMGIAWDGSLRLRDAGGQELFVHSGDASIKDLDSWQNGETGRKKG